MIKNITTTLVGLLMALMPAAAQEATTTVSLLTCSPGEEIHRLYGHSALRITERESVSDEEWKVISDWGVNFGWFSFNTPNFVGRFILGLTDYSMAYQTMPIFVNDLMRDDMKVTEQVLNLTPEEALYVKDACDAILNKQGYERRDYNFDGYDRTETILSAHWTYRYNFLYDNCTTRPVALIKEALEAHGETLVYPDPLEGETTQRDMIHEFTKDSPWYEFGQDLLLGPEVDEVHSYKELADSLNFLPTYAEDFYAHAQIKGQNGRLRPLVAETGDLTPFLQPQPRHPAVPFTPLGLSALLAAVGVLIIFFERKTARKAQQLGRATVASRAWRIWGNAFDFTAWTLQGIVGILLVIMVCFSKHPAVGTNWLLLVFNPLFFLGIPCRLKWTKWDTPFCVMVVVAWMSLIIIDLFDVQEIPTALEILALPLALRCAAPIDALLLRRKKRPATANVSEQDEKSE